MTEYFHYDRDWLIHLFRKQKMPKLIYFWGHGGQSKESVTKACLSQWWPCEFNVDGDTYASAEHWMMAEKAKLFNDKVILKKIMSTRKPGAAKALGRQIKAFNQEVWNEAKFGIVVKGNFYKFSQNPDLKAFLVNTRRRVLIEASPIDTVWGIGLAKDDPNAENPLAWKGENLLGFALMSARDLLQDS
jgi:ribA/ribD-fused uncharacterized protein